jgi:hypothetical protein
MVEETDSCFFVNGQSNLEPGAGIHRFSSPPRPTAVSATQTTDDAMPHSRLFSIPDPSPTSFSLTPLRLLRPLPNLDSLTIPVIHSFHHFSSVLGLFNQTETLQPNGQNIVIPSDHRSTFSVPSDSFQISGATNSSPKLSSENPTAKSEISQ